MVGVCEPLQDKCRKKFQNNVIICVVYVHLTFKAVGCAGLEEPIEGDEREREQQIGSENGAFLGCLLRNV